METPGVIRHGRPNLRAAAESRALKLMHCSDGGLPHGEDKLLSNPQLKRSQAQLATVIQDGPSVRAAGDKMNIHLRFSCAHGCGQMSDSQEKVKPAVHLSQPLHLAELWSSPRDEEDREARRR